MGTPAKFLPPALSSETINTLLVDLSLPLPKSVAPLQVTAEFHAIYLISYPLSAAPQLLPAKTPNTDGETISLILRVSGNHLQSVKTRNEVAVLRWVEENTSIPVPAIVRWDDTCDNALGAEFTLLEKMEGQSVDKLYDSMGEDAKLYLVRQLIDMTVELNSFEWNHVGGLQIDVKGEIVPGPLLEDSFWFIPDVIKYWPGEKAESLNPMKIFNDHAGLVQGWLEIFIYAIKRHPTLAWLEDLIPKLETLTAMLPSLGDLGTTKLVLAHKDVHFANVMAKPDGTITAILDWEFATVVPALRWDPSRAFLWNGVGTEEAHQEKYRLRSIFEEHLRERGIEKWWEGAGQDVKDIWTVIAYVRALVEVCPRGQRADTVEEWRRIVEETLEKLGSKGTSPEPAPVEGQ